LSLNTYRTEIWSLSTIHSHFP